MQQQLSAKKTDSPILRLGCPDDSLPSSQHSSLGSTSSGDEQSSIIPVLSPSRELDARSIKLVSPIYSGSKERSYNIFDFSYTFTTDKPVFESSPDFFEFLFVTEMQSIPRSPDQWDFHHSVFHFLEIYLLSYRPGKLPLFPFSNDFSFRSFSPTFIEFIQF